MAWLYIVQNVAEKWFFFPIFLLKWNDNLHSQNAKCRLPQVHMLLNASTTFARKISNQVRNKYKTQNAKTLKALPVCSYTQVNSGETKNAFLKHRAPGNHPRPKGQDQGHKVIYLWYHLKMLDPRNIRTKANMVLCTDQNVEVCEQTYRQTDTQTDLKQNKSPWSNDQLSF